MSSIEAAKVSLKGLAHRTWNAPSEFFADQKLDRRDVFVVAARTGKHGVAAGERLFVIGAVVPGTR
ncbi:hypothetical protein [Bradyrhizobium japonicum]|uniref:hypothetical protein n=1 Tax=Bradyrhizobium japonicum TaxID=375 RepID=UPI001BAACD81|nr:hypothetical protein [Bradyrhizobium japonicum]MBR0911483.1 hypothetical protein [Bradyrhizobium japonicum]